LRGAFSWSLREEYPLRPREGRDFRERLLGLGDDLWTAGPPLATASFAFADVSSAAH
jgi:hypothetical protein